MARAERTTTPRTVLTAWLALHSRAHPLTTSQKMEFTQHPLMPAICKYRFEEVYACLVTHRKLSDVLAALERGEGLGRSSNAHLGAPRDKGKGKSRGATPPTSTSNPKAGSTEQGRAQPRPSTTSAPPPDNRTRRSGRKYRVNKRPAASREQARSATPDFDKKNRPDYN